jgi:hypothetical protein
VRRKTTPLVAVAALFGLVVAGCSTPSSRIRLPECADEISVSGQHARGERTTLILDHAWDLPMTRTQVTVEQAGKTREFEIVNNTPDVWRLLGGSVMGLFGAGLASRYGYGVAALGEDPVRSPWLWSLPCGLTMCGVASTLMLTGWHPGGDTVIEGQCEEPAPRSPGGGR